VTGQPESINIADSLQGEKYGRKARGDLKAFPRKRPG
jgi:hypothetical protein